MKNDMDLYKAMSAGMDIKNPMAYGIINMMPTTSRELTWAEKKRDELIWGLKRNKARMNRFMVTICMILAISIIFGATTLLSIFASHYITTVLLGIMDAQLIILSYLFLIGTFECNPSFIRESQVRKRKRRKKIVPSVNNRYFK